MLPRNEDPNNPDTRLPQLPPAEDVLYQLAIGLYYIHKMGLIKGDIKLQNVHIWVNPQNEEVLMKWADFVFGKEDGINFTTNWLAPELLKILDGGKENLSSTSKSDVFAEGLVFSYNLLCGSHLFGSPSKIASNITENNPVNLPGNSDFL